jgi:uncharacterized oligopeptide transporter (OPT) family protein
VASETRRPYRPLRWFAAVTGLVAGVMVASNTVITGWGFVVFTISSIAWILTGWLLPDRSLLTLNSDLLLVNLLGIYRWLL